MLYKIEHRIFTLSSNAVMLDKNHPASFEIENIKFSHLGFDYIKGWQGYLWLSKGEIEASSAVDAINTFSKKLGKIIPRIVLISQSYAQFMAEPWLVKKVGSDIALYRHTVDRVGGGLMFREKEKEALEILIEEKNIPEAFYYYWNDAVNSIGQSSKLLLMFSAVESLAKDLQGKKDWQKVRQVLGEDLTMDIFGTKENSKSALRNRLVHGEYLDAKDVKYVELVHKKVLSYFNENIFKKDLINLEVVNPQRHPFGNKTGGFVFIKQKSEVDLMEVHSTFNDKGVVSSEKYEIVYPENAFRLSF